MPCAECGASLERGASDEHACDPERRLEYQLFQLRETTARFEDDLDAYLETPHGRFAVWHAAYLRTQGA